MPAYTLQPDYAVYIQSATRLTADDVLLLVQEGAAEGRDQPGTSR